MPREGPRTAEERVRAIDTIAAGPARFRAAFAGLRDEQLDTPYRDGGWTLRQLAHHVPDSHMNAYVRFKLALTETNPTIRPYDENLWGQLPECRTAPIDMSLALLDALHQRWAAAHRALGEADFERAFWHPELERHITVNDQLSQYVWHFAHHTAHIANLRAAKGWN